jgi:hypothetical protein
MKLAVALFVVALSTWPCIAQQVKNNGAELQWPSEEEWTEQYPNQAILDASTVYIQATLSPDEDLRIPAWFEYRYKRAGPKVAELHIFIRKVGDEYQMVARRGKERALLVKATYLPSLWYRMLQAVEKEDAELAQLWLHRQPGRYARLCREFTKDDLFEQPRTEGLLGKHSKVHLVSNLEPIRDEPSGVPDWFRANFEVVPWDRAELIVFVCKTVRRAQGPHDPIYNVFVIGREEIGGGTAHFLGTSPTEMWQSMRRMVELEKEIAAIEKKLKAEKQKHLKKEPRRPTKRLIDQLRRA